MNHGLGRLNDRPLDLRLIRELHANLMRGVRRHHETPGEFRKVQNFIATTSEIADARFVPPPVLEMNRCLTDLEQFIHIDALASQGRVARADVPPLLVRLALVHYQFETIHPFRDGNGRVGRLLIPLMLCGEQRLARPLLYMSAYFERHRHAYYDHMLAVSQRGAWRDWILFFLRGVLESATEAFEQGQALDDLRESYRERLSSARSSALLLKLVDELFRRPSMTRKQAATVLDVSDATASANIQRLVEQDILATAGKKGRTEVFLAPDILAFVSQP